MNKQRRLFLTQLSAIAGVAVINKPLNSVAAVSKRINTIYSEGYAVTIYHTNNLHGKTDAVFNNMGGLSQVKALIEQQDIGGLMFDAGNFLNNKKNLSDHKYIIHAMNSMGYHAAAPGSNELMYGQEHLASLVPLMKFNLVNCNYRFNTVLACLIKPYVTINAGSFKIGITGVGKPLNGVIYADAVKCANEAARVLRETENCDLVICLSHLGDDTEGNTPCNKEFAKLSENIDLIIADHSDKLMKGPRIVRNAMKNQVVLSQTGWQGIMAGKTVFTFASQKQKSGIKAKYFIPGQSPYQTFDQSLAILRSKEKAA